MDDFQTGEQMLSVGIDIGTSTTKMVISQLLLKNTAGVTRVPSIEIVDKKIIYQSPIFRTPLKSVTEIDMPKVEKLLEEQYRKAQITPQEVQTGAVIITGETATKANAEEVLHHLSSQGGDFLVATAGPDLEAILAAKGSGVYDASKQSNKVFANIDIGGGTANIAVYQYGKLLGTCTLHIGGKLIEFNNGVIHYMSRHVKKALTQIEVDVKNDRYLNPGDLNKLANRLADVLALILQNQVGANEVPFVLGHGPNWPKPIDVITFSGGVAECIYQMEESSTSYDDIGHALAQALVNNQQLASYEWRKPNVTSRATVIGAGTQTTEISGATIRVESSLLPIKNIPVHRIELEESTNKSLSDIPHAIKEGMELYDPYHEGQNFALYLANLPLLGFRDIQRLMDALMEGAYYKKDFSQPLIIIVERDLAKAIGQSLHARYPHQKCICIDQIKVEHGDYIDIGKELRSGVVPVVIKTLTF